MTPEKATEIVTKQLTSQTQQQTKKIHQELWSDTKVAMPESYRYLYVIKDQNDQTKYLGMLSTTTYLDTQEAYDLLRSEIYTILDWNCMQDTKFARQQIKILSPNNHSFDGLLATNHFESNHSLKRLTFCAGSDTEDELGTEYDYDLSCYQLRNPLAHQLTLQKLANLLQH